MLKRADLIELALNYAGIATVYAVVLVFVGPARLADGMAPSLVLTSLLLWYPFAIKTHEGYSTGSPESRSHNYYGRWMYWFSLGLSMHREHHLQPGLPWLELREYVEEAPRGRLWVLPRRDVRVAARAR
jgi:fatty acid desaturase